MNIVRPIAEVALAHTSFEMFQSWLVKGTMTTHVLGREWETLVRQVDFWVTLEYEELTTMTWMQQYYHQEVLQNCYHPVQQQLLQLPSC